ncbi:hypothetical protein BKA56DRAFT_566477 [Ilyonectria sp. MPI-CAGE-AT-0026]|nr:hypothetical protein BKA56DRAFT_566477 [Ilyonectria sp. MPI-CAGE-AT-0026]
MPQLNRARGHRPWPPCRRGVRGPSGELDNNGKQENRPKSPTTHGTDATQRAPGESSRLETSSCMRRRDRHLPTLSVFLASCRAGSSPYWALGTTLPSRSDLSSYPWLVRVFGRHVAVRPRLWALGSGLWLRHPPADRRWNHSACIQPILGPMDPPVPLSSAPPDPQVGLVGQGKRNSGARDGARDARDGAREESRRAALTQSHVRAFPVWVALEDQSLRFLDS